MKPDICWRHKVSEWRIPDESKDTTLAMSVSNMSLPKEIVKFPSQEIFRSYLNMTLNSQTGQKISALRGRLDYTDPFKLNYSMI